MKILNSSGLHCFFSILLLKSSNVTYGNVSGNQNEQGKEFMKFSFEGFLSAIGKASLIYKVKGIFTS